MIHYRYATKEDISLLVELRLQFLEAKTDQSNFLEIFLNTKQFIETGFTYGTFQSLLAYDDNKLIGEVMLYYSDTIPSLYNLTGKCAYITNLHVNIKYRRNGIGTYMIQSLMNNVKQNQIHAIFANTTDACEALFQGLCFSKVNNMMVYQD